jgi:hypothetical protein
MRLRVSLFQRGHEIQEGWSRDLSAGGLRVDQVAAPVDSPVRLALSVPAGPLEEDRVFFVYGKVAWRRLSSAGVRFLNPHPAMIAYFEEVIRLHHEGGQVLSN